MSESDIDVFMKAANVLRLAYGEKALRLRESAERITLLETQVAELRAALQQCRILLDGVGHHDKHDARLANQIGRVIQAVLASPAAICETCGKPHPCWCPAPDARPAAKEKENAGK